MNDKTLKTVYYTDAIKGAAYVGLAAAGGATGYYGSKEVFVYFSKHHSHGADYHRRLDTVPLEWGICGAAAGVALAMYFTKNKIFTQIGEKLHDVFHGKNDRSFKL